MSGPYSRMQWEVGIFLEGTSWRHSNKKRGGRGGGLWGKKRGRGEGGGQDALGLWNCFERRSLASSKNNRFNEGGKRGEEGDGGLPSPTPPSHSLLPPSPSSPNRRPQFPPRSPQIDTANRTSAVLGGEEVGEDTAVLPRSVLPSLPRIWCSWLRPNISAFSTTHTPARGTSTPTYYTTFTARAV